MEIVATKWSADDKTIKKKKKNAQSLSDLWSNTKQSNVCVTGIWEEWTENTLWRNNKNFLKLRKTINPQIQNCHQTSSKNKYTHKNKNKQKTHAKAHHKSNCW